MNGIKKLKLKIQKRRADNKFIRELLRNPQKHEEFWTAVETFMKTHPKPLTSKDSPGL